MFVLWTREWSNIDLRSFFLATGFFYKKKESLRQVRVGSSPKLKI